MALIHIDVRYLAVTLKIRTHGRRIVRRSHVNVDIYDRSHHAHVLSLDTMEILDTFILLYTFIHKRFGILLYTLEPSISWTTRTTVATTHSIM